MRTDSQNKYPSTDLSVASWSKTALTVTANQAIAPDGTMTAALITDTATSTLHIILSAANPSETNGVVMTMSIYAKRVNTNYLSFYANNGADAFAQFNLVTGLVSSTGGGTPFISAAMESVGNGWYRCSLTFVKRDISGYAERIYIYNSADALVFNGDGTNLIYLWGPQEVVGYRAGDFLATTGNYVSIGGVRSAVQTRQNFVLRSAEFDNASWIKGSTTVVANQAANPVDAAATADLVYPTTTGSNRYVYQTVSMTTGLGRGMTFSVFAKAAGLNFIAIVDPSGSNYRAWFNLATGAVGTVVAGWTAAIQSLGNDWYRCSLTQEAAVGYGTAYYQIAVCDADNSTTATTSGTNGALLFGAQMVFGSRPGDYQVTTTVAVNTGGLRQLV